MGRLMARVNALALIAGAACLVVAFALVDVRLALGALGLCLIAAAVERP